MTIRRGIRAALKNVSLGIDSGEHIAILGPNGSGKSTLIKAITRELYPTPTDRTVFRMMGEDMWDIFSLRKHLGIVSADLQSTLTRDITGREMVLSGYFSHTGLWPGDTITPAMERQGRSLLRWLGISHLADRPVTQVSSGESRKLLIGRALVHKPQALLLDEPTNNLDLKAAHLFRETLRKVARAGIGLLLVTHTVADIIPEIDRVLFLKEGRIVADGPKRNIFTVQALKKLFGLSVGLTQRKGYYHLH